MFEFSHERFQNCIISLNDTIVDIANESSVNTIASFYVVENFIKLMIRVVQAEH